MKFERAWRGLPSNFFQPARSLPLKSGVQPAEGQVELGPGDPGLERPGVAFSLGLPKQRDDLVEDRAGAVELPGIRQATGLTFEACGRVRVVGSQLRPPQGQRLDDYRNLKRHRFESPATARLSRPHRRLYGQGALSRGARVSRAGGGAIVIGHGSCRTGRTFRDHSAARW